LLKMPHHIVTHDSSGQTKFSTKIPTEYANVNFAAGSYNFLWTSWSLPLNVSSEEDIDQYAKDRTEGLGWDLCPAKGSAAAIVNMPPNSESPWHRTMTVDIVYVLEGTVELHLTSGEERTLKPGDSVVQRAGMHKWKNVTENEGWVRMLGFSQPVVEPVEAGGKQLRTEFVMDQ
jgi:quercetin dioxygenase-like cupin family protein